jgi:glucosamine--fructose-6-phosphate aminotransferase (isomerizing)
VCLTNDPGSPLAASADVTVPFGAGDERAVAATKTYTAELLLVALLSATLADDDAMLAHLASVPDRVAEALEAGDEAHPAAEGLAGQDRCVVVSRGFNFATAFEWALKLQELCSVVALPLSAADFRHGPIGLAEPGFPLLAVAPSGTQHARLHALLRELTAERQLDLTVISDHPATLLLGRGVPLPSGVEEWATPIVAAPTLQLFCFHLARALGLDPDHPRGLQKVTRTR